MGTLLIKRLFVSLLLGVSLISAGELALSPPAEAELAKSLGGVDVLQMIRQADKVQAGRVVLKRKLIETRKPVEIPPELANRAKELMSARTTYFNGSSMCVFAPGVELLFHDHEVGTVTMVLCLNCADVSVMRNGGQVGFASFAKGEKEVRALMREIFPKDDDIRQLIEEDETITKHNADTRTRWIAAMPKSLLPYWENMPMNGMDEDLDPLRRALAKEFPNKSQRILALLAWYGCGEGAWSGFPTYELTAENMLLDYSTADLISAIVDQSLTDPQSEGAARLFGGWEFGVKRPDDRAMLPPALKKTLLAHEKRSPIKDNIQRAKRALH